MTGGGREDGIAPRRAALLDQVAARLLTRAGAGVLRVAIDGVDGAGKTVFADELAPRLAAADRPVIRASVDGFHQPRALRYRQGKGSPRGFYEDSYDYDRLCAWLLDPLGPDGNRRYRTAAFDHRSDRPVVAPEQRAPEGAILLLDGIFLHRPLLRHHWDLSLFLHVDVARSVARCAARDGSDPDPAAAANRRYVEGQRLYLTTCEPWRLATLVVDNNDLAAPYLLPQAHRDAS